VGNVDVDDERAAVRVILRPSHDGLDVIDFRQFPLRRVQVRSPEVDPVGGIVNLPRLVPWIDLPGVDSQSSPPQVSQPLPSQELLKVVRVAPVEPSCTEYQMAHEIHQPDPCAPVPLPGGTYTVL
jgi:hypothetical protein